MSKKGEIVSQAKRFDFVIIGAGSAGCVLANRLVKNTPFNVALIEAGPSDNHPAIQIPFGLSVLSRFKGFNWGLTTSPEPHCANRKMFWPRGKTLGGSSSVNAMVYIRGDKVDYDAWAEKCDAPQWRFDNLLPIFKQLENNARGPDAYHGIGGELSVSDPNHVDDLSHAWITACEEAGIAHNPDFNAALRYGAGLYQTTTGQGKRSSSARAFLTPILNNPRFTLFTGATVSKILFDDKQAVAVAMKHQGKSLRVEASKEILLSAGAVHSPHILMQSGVGDGEQLSRHGIDVVHDCFGVGKNLQDHLDVIVQAKATRSCGYAIRPMQWGQYIKGFFDYASKKQGLFTSNIAEAGGFVASRYGSVQRPDIQLHFIPAVLLDHGRQTSLRYGFGVHACNLYPFSRGEIQLSEQPSHESPIIKANYLSDIRDIEIMQDALRVAQKTLLQPALAPWQPALMEPISELDGSAQIDFIKNHAETIYHPVGTCKMGRINDPDAVVNPQLQVIGLGNLRVVDASIMPTIIGGNTNAPTMMIAEHAAQMIITTHLKDTQHELTSSR